MKFVFGVNNFTSAGATPFVDTVNVGLGAATGLAGLNTTAVTVTAPVSATDQISATTIKNAIDNTNTAASIFNMICGNSAGCGGKPTRST